VLEKLHCPNPVPLRETRERWIEEYERDRLPALSNLEEHFEGKMKTKQFRPKTAYVSSASLLHRVRSGRR
jgi:hypothetical protein